MSGPGSGWRTSPPLPLQLTPHSTLDRRPQRLWMKEEEDGEESQPLEVSSRSDSCGKPAPHPTGKPAQPPGCWESAPLAAPTLKRIPHRTKFTSRGTLRRGALTLSEAGRWLPPGLQMRRAGGGGLVSDIRALHMMGTGQQGAGGPKVAPNSLCCHLLGFTCGFSFN